MKVNDYKPETESLINRLLHEGFELVGGNDGEEDFKFTGNLVEFIEEITGTDSARLYVKHDDTKKPIFLDLVFGNEPGALVSDYIVNTLLDKVVKRHYKVWSRKPQAVRFGEYVNGKWVDEKDNSQK